MRRRAAAGPVGLTAGQWFLLVTWAVLWWHLARWLVRLVVLLVLAAAAGRRKKGAEHGG